MNMTELKSLIKEQTAGIVKENLMGQLKSQVEDSIKGIIGPYKAGKEVDSNRRDENPSGFDSFSDFAQSVYKAGPSGRNADHKLRTFEKAAGSPSLLETDSEAGGYLIPEEFRTQLLTTAVEKTNILTRAMKIPMKTNSISIPFISGFDHSGGLLHGGVEFKWLDEVAGKTETRPKFGKINLKLKKCAGLCYASDEILEDSPISMQPLLNSAFTDALAWSLDWVFINGTGAGQPLGVLNASCLVTIAKESGQAADTIVYENIVNMYSRLWRTDNAIWLANKNTFPQLATMTLGTANYPIYLPANSAAGRPFNTLMGLPLIFTEHCRTIGDVGDIILADWSQYLVGQKSTGLKFASSIHLKFDYDQTAFRFVYRVDGQPWWISALTPRYSSETLSPFVAIADRA
jgi:HK97 family phage major capsid protein